MRQERRRQNLDEGRALAAEALAQAERVHATFDELLVELERQPVESVTDEAFDYVTDQIARYEIRIEGLRGAIATHAKLLNEGRLLVETSRNASPAERADAWRDANARMRWLQLIADEAERLHEEIAAAEATIAEFTILRADLLAAAQSAAAAAPADG